MKFSFLIYSYFPYGGQQRDFLRIVTECLQRGHEVDVYTRSWQGEVPENLNLVLVPVRAFSRVGVYRRFTSWVADALARQAPHTVVGFNKMPLLDVYFAADPCFAEKVASQRGFYYRYTPRFRHFREYEEAVFGAASHTEVMLLSPQQHEAFSKHYPGSDHRLHDLPPGISPDRRATQRDPALRSALRNELGIDENTLLLLQVGSGFRVKGVDRSLRAFAALPAALSHHCRYLLVGQDKPNPFLRLARQLGVESQVTILPGRDDIPRFLAAADLLLHPAYLESAGYVLLEATIAGLPVLTTGSCGYAFHIERAQSGEVCGEPFQQADLNARLQQMLQQLPTASWSANGLQYGNNQDLYAMPQVAADLIERFALAKQQQQNQKPKNQNQQQATSAS